MSFKPTISEPLLTEFSEMATPLEVKTCCICGQTLPLIEFSRDSSRKDGLQFRCKKRDKNKNSNYYRDNPEYFERYKKENREQILAQQRECQFLNRPIKGGGYLRGTGICIFCGEIEPFLLELHHPFGKKHPSKIHECANCHCLQHRFPAMLEVTL